MERHFTATVYVLNQDKILLHQHPKHKSKWLPPGGHIEENETPPEAAIREVLEETGLHVKLISQENVWCEFDHAKSFERPFLCLLENIPGSPFHQHMDLIYLAYPISGTLKDEFQWFSLDMVKNLKENIEIFPDTKQIVEKIFNADVPHSFAGGRSF